jgi:glycosyltransferase involved in cell wall biosynthesis
MYARIVAISEQVRRQLIEDGAPDDRIDVIHSAIDADAYEPTWTRNRFVETFGYAAQHLVVACVAQLIPRKGHADLLAAWPEVVRRHSNARLLLLGQGRLERNLKQTIARSEAVATIQVAGFRPDLRAFLGRIDVLVHPAAREGLGVVLLEAQAAGVPIVATAAGGIPEAVAANESALLVAPGNRAALAAALTRLLDDPKLRAALGAAGRRHVADRFTVTRMVDRYIHVYERLLGSGQAQVGS